MPLLALSNELLTLIIKETLPEGFENFMLTCKDVYAVGEAFIPKHNELKKKYGQFEYPSFREDRVDTNPYLSSMQLLQDIIKEPLIVRYFRDVNFEDERIIHINEPDSNLIDAFRANAQFKNDLLRLLGSSTYLRLAKQNPQEWLDAILGNRGYLYSATLLLTMLPNVEKLSLPAFWISFPGQKASSVLNIITQRANDDKNGTASLGRLSTVGLSTSTRPGWSHCFQTQDPATFLNITSVREFHGANLLAGYGVSGVPHLTAMPYSPNVEMGLQHVELTNCFFKEREFCNFVGSMSRLKTFQFCYGSVFRTGLRIWEAGTVTTALMDAASQTLENLIVYDVADHCTPRPGEVNDLRGFKNLKNLTLEVSPFFDVPMPRLVDVLPSSIERLQLVVENREALSLGWLQSLFADYDVEKAAKLPALTDIKVCGFQVLYRLDGTKYRVPKPFSFLKKQEIAVKFWGGPLIV